MGTAEIPPGIKKESQVKVAAQEGKKKKRKQDVEREEEEEDGAK